MQPQCWTGTSFPPTSAWVSYATLWNISAPLMAYLGDTPQEISAINNAVQWWSYQIKSDPYAPPSSFPQTRVADRLAPSDSRFTLAIIMRESSGLTTVACGDGGASCGMMQVQGTGVPVCTAHPCSENTIGYQIACGTAGGCGGAGANIKYCAGMYGSGNYGALARCYNTGYVYNAADLTRCKYGIPSYVNDIANILLGAQPSAWQALEGKCFPSNVCSG